MPLISTALPLALKGLAALFTMPAGLVVAGVIGAIAVWKNWDKIGPIVEGVYTAVKTWLVDKFAAVVKWIGEKVGQVTGFFKGMYDAVVGHSYVPDMIDGISREFGQLDRVMVTPTYVATRGVEGAFSGLFSSLKSKLPSWAGGLFDAATTPIMSSLNSLTDKISGHISGMFGNLFGSGGGSGGMFGSMMQQGMGMFLQPGGPLGSLIQAGVNKLVDLAVAGIKKLGSKIKDWAGGPSEAELEGREYAKAFREGLADGLSARQMEEVLKAGKGNETWAATVIAIRDAYIAAGKTEQEALDVADRLWRAEKEGGDAVKWVIREIESVMDQARYAQQDMTSSAVSGFGNVRDSIRTVGKEMQIIRDEFGNEIVVPVRYDIQGAPGGGGSQPSYLPPPAEGNTDALFRDQGVLDAWVNDFPEWADRIRTFLESGGRGDESRAPGDLGLPNFWEWYHKKGFRGADAGGVFSKPAMRVIAERSPEIVGQPNTIVSALAQAMERSDFNGKARSGGDVHFHLTTPIATVDTVRQMVYQEIGPVLIDWLNNNKSGARTKMRIALGFTAA
jgi:hypothetical protein